jgi:hypothetical protein
MINIKQIRPYGKHLGIDKVPTTINGHPSYPITLPSVIFLKIKKVLITGKDAKQISIPTEKIPVKCKIKKTTQNLAKLVL